MRQDSGGDGKRRGGLGLRREIRVLSEEASLSVLSDKNIIPPFGVLGGFSGAPNRFTVIRKGQSISPSQFPGKVTRFPLERGDVVVMESSGGGGYGDPLERDPERIEKDLGEGLITKEKAETR
jgi:N-methylhydantoinase B